MKTTPPKTIRLAIAIACTLLLIITGCDPGGGDDDDSQDDSDSSLCSDAQYELKPVDFQNTWTTDVTVRVYEYDLACSDMTFQDPSDVAFGLGSPGIDLDAHLELPQGKYSICIDWFDYDDDTYYHKLYGSLPDDVFFELNENSNEIIPLKKLVEAGFPNNGTGRCPTPENKTGGGDGEENGSFDITSFRNFDSSTGTDMDQADIQISGNSSYPDISWNRNDANQIQVLDDQGAPLYGIGASQNMQGNTIYLTSPIQYGDYSVSNTFRLLFYPSTSPAMISGDTYSITIGTEAGAYAQLVFTVR